MDSWRNLKSLGVLLGASVFLLVPASFDAGIDSGEGPDGSPIQAASVCAQSHICGYVDGPTCPSDPYSQCEVGCDEDDDDQCLEAC